MKKMSFSQDRIQEIFTGIFQDFNAAEPELDRRELQTLIGKAIEHFSRSEDVSGRTLEQYQHATTRYKRAWHPRKPARRKKKLLIVSGMFPGTGHGGGLRIFDVLEELASKGHELWLYAVTPQPGEEKDFRHLKRLLKGVRLREWRDFTHEDLASWVNGIGVEFDDSYHVWPNAGGLIRPDFAPAGKPIFEFIEVTTRRVWMDFVSMTRENRFENLAAKFDEFWLYYCFESQAVLNAARLVCVTSKDADFVKKALHVRKPVVVPTCISRHAVVRDLKKYAKTKALKKSVGFLGYYNHYPNLDGVEWYLKHVHPKIQAAVPDYRFHVMGKGPLETLKRQFESATGVVWIGEVKDIVPALKKMEICVTPLINGAGIRGKVNQYSMVGRPFVSTKIGVCGTPYRNNRSALITDDPNRFAKSVIRLLQEPKLGARLSKEAGKIVKKHFFWDSAIRKLESLF